MTRQMHIIVYGCGPAGWLMATALQARGVRTTLIGDAPDAPWPARYGLWADEVDERLTMSAASWSSVSVHLAEAAELTVSRGYVRVDGESMRRGLRQRFGDAGGVVIQDRVVRVARQGDGVLVSTERAEHLVDGVIAAAGGQGRQATAFQTAYGVEVELTAGELHEMRLMDWRPLSQPVDDDPRPSFLYAMPLGDGRVFLEETALAARPPVSLDVLERRLAQRIADNGWRVSEAHERERCVIPLDISPQLQLEPALRFGAAAGMVHPATGYQLAYAARMAAPVAEQIAARWERGAAAEEAMKGGLDTLWSEEARRSHQLYGFGLDVVCELDTAQTLAFFRAFFSLPPSTFHGYLDRTLSVRQLSGAMMQLFLRAPLGIQRALVKHGWQGRARLASAITGASKPTSPRPNHGPMALSENSDAPLRPQMNP